MAKLVIVVDDPESAMDSGCLYEILQECRNHGPIASAKYVLDDGHENELEYLYKTLEPEGRC